jgi:hypothetical protein
MGKKMRKFKPLLLLLMSLLVIATSCQPATPEPTLPPTRTATPLPPTTTPVPTSEPTLVVDLKALEGKVVKVAYPYLTDKNRFNQLVDGF